MKKTTDLMIGDWVMYNPNVFIEDEYEPPKPCYTTQILSGEDIDTAIERCYSPIPLTAEILEKNGFEDLKTDEGLFLFEHYNDNNNCYIIRYSHLISELDIKFDSDTISFYLIKHLKIEYVHELQHALRMCCIDKEITL